MLPEEYFFKKNLMAMYNVSLELRVSKLALLNIAIKKYTHDFPRN